MPRYGRPPRGGNGIFTAIIGVIILRELYTSLHHQQHIVFLIFS